MRPGVSDCRNAVDVTAGVGLGGAAVGIRLSVGDDRGPAVAGGLLDTDGDALGLALGEGGRGGQV